MKQYQRALEKEFERFLINEDYQEQEEYKKDLEEIKTEYFSGLVEILRKDNGWERIFSSPDIKRDDERVVDKVEGVTKEMREEYFSLDPEGYITLGDDCLDADEDWSGVFPSPDRLEYEHDNCFGDDYSEIEQEANYKDGEGII
ncbi:MAG: hypothetical protein AABX99_02755 [Nanoarchaeota archaeon]